MRLSRSDGRERRVIRQQGDVVVVEVVSFYGGWTTFEVGTLVGRRLDPSTRRAFTSLAEAEARLTWLTTPRAVGFVVAQGGGNLT
jgi:hypothetical protein